MGIWIELGIFVLVLVFGIWQWQDARQALERSRAHRQRTQAQVPAQGEPPLPPAP